MFGFNKNKKPADRIRAADKSTQRLRKKRSKLSPVLDKKKIKRINSKIHKNKVETKIAYCELAHPETKKTTNNVSFNYSKNEKQLHMHGHYHSSNKDED